VWLQVALLAHRAAALPPHERAPHLATIRGLLPGGSGDIFDAIIGCALRMEDAARLQLGISTLDAVMHLCPANNVVVRGRALAYQARLIRHLGELAESETRYRAVEAMGLEHGAPSVMARAWAGLGTLAQLRGNLPVAREHFTRVLARPEAAPETRQAAHHGLMVCAASAGDLGLAAQHGWHAYGEAPEGDRVAALINLSESLLRAGHARAALSGFAAALRQRTIPRAELPALGGLAIAAVRALEPSEAQTVLGAASRRIEGLINQTNLPYVHASALLDLADASATVGRTKSAESYWARAREIAMRHQYHELMFRAESAADAARRDLRKRVTESPAPTYIVEAVEALVDRNEILTAVLAGV